MSDVGVPVRLRLRAVADSILAGYRSIDDDDLVDLLDDAYDEIAELEEAHMRSSHMVLALSRQIDGEDA